MSAPAIVMNMFCTGLGIARCLGRRGIPVIGLSAQPRVYGAFTRHARTLASPDSRHAPEALADFLVQLAPTLDGRPVIFPTRDDDVVFLDRFREVLEPHYELVVPARGVTEACLDKWQTYQWACRAQVPTPRCWMIESDADLARQLSEITFPCVLKPVAAHHWRRGGNWQLVGGRKAVAVESRDELLREYPALKQADSRVLVQELISGGDDALLIAACYFDRDSRYVAGFNTRKLLQVPEGFGTGCIVEAAHAPDLFGPTIELLTAMRYTGIAEVEYKLDRDTQVYKLIEVNPRPWDQHRLGGASGVDLVYVAYCEHAGLPRPALGGELRACKWIAEDAFLHTAFSLLAHGDPGWRKMLRLARGRRIYAIWDARDPLPSLIYLVLHLLPGLARGAWHAFGRLFSPGRSRTALPHLKGREERV